MGALAKLRALTPAERQLLVVALATAPFVAFGLTIFGFRRTHSALARWSQPRGEPVPTGDAATARALSAARIVGIAAGSGPVRTSCLRRSLLLWSLLRREGIETALRVGVNRDDGTFRAHAWVEYRGKPLNDDEDIAARFPAFAQDFGASRAEAS
jgi:hypothetical protein